MHSGKLTKIIATLGPASESEHIIRELIEHGVNIFRFNMKHNTNEWHLERIKRVQEQAEQLGITIGTLIDLQGPEIRIETHHGVEIPVTKHEEIIFSPDFTINDPVGKDYPKDRIVKVIKPVIDALQVEDHFTIDDGFIEFEVVFKNHEFVLARAHDDAVIKNRKGLNLMQRDVDLPSLTHEDIARLEVGAKTHVDFIALSFVRTAQDIRTLRHEMDKQNVKAKIVSKVESQKGVDNIDEIIEETDAVMIARGDLGIEIPIERVTHLQKQIIKKCRAKNKPVIVATQMLQSMIDSPRPTRAEAADVANAVFDETDCVMLSGETASGKYPVKAVEVMKRILKYNEAKKEPVPFTPSELDQTYLVVNSAVTMLQAKGTLKIDKVIIFTETGTTARVMASFRPEIPILAVSEDLRTVHTLTMSYGVMPFNFKFESGDFTVPANIIEMMKKTDFLNEGETVLILHGRKWKEPGKTNALLILTV